MNKDIKNKIIIRPCLNEKNSMFVYQSEENSGFVTKDLARIENFLLQELEGKNIQEYMQSVFFNFPHKIYRKYYNLAASFLGDDMQIYILGSLINDLKNLIEELKIKAKRNALECTKALLETKDVKILDISMGNYIDSEEVIKFNSNSEGTTYFDIDKKVAIENVRDLVEKFKEINGAYYYYDIIGDMLTLYFQNFQKEINFIGFNRDKNLEGYVKSLIRK